MKILTFEKALKILIVGLLFSVSIGVKGEVATDTLVSVDSIAASEVKQDEREAVKKVLFIGDSMTGWLSERLGAYGEENGFEVATIVWDGSTISKWARSGKLLRIVNKHKPDVIFVSLGLNELLERNPERNLSKSLETIKQSFGNVPYVWIGPPSWPGKGKGEALNDWLKANLKENCYFYSSDLDLPRQSRTNPHPTRDGVVKWMDIIVEWLPEGPVYFQSLKKPNLHKMVRGKTFIYRKMKEYL